VLRHVLGTYTSSTGVSNISQPPCEIPTVLGCQVLEVGLSRVAVKWSKQVADDALLGMAH
jgi:hypothetical protein